MPIVDEDDEPIPVPPTPPVPGPVPGPTPPVPIPPQPIPDPDPLYGPSYDALNLIRYNNPEFANELLPGLSNLCQYHVGTNNEGIKCYMFNKIRIKLGLIGKRHGYPARLHHTVMFFDLLMFSVPFYTKLQVMKTMEYWDNNNLQMDIGGGQTAQISKRIDFQWRQVWIYDLPNEYVQFILSAIPTNIDNAIIDAVMQTTSRVWPVFEYLLDPGGIHDKIITCNWDKILQVLNQNGY